MHWLGRYASGYHKWNTATHDGQQIFFRPLGVVENTFDSDGVYHEGRADINLGASLEIKCPPDPQELNTRLLLAYACLRLQFPLLGARASLRPDFVDHRADQQRGRYFLVGQSGNVNQSIREAQQSFALVKGPEGRSTPADFYYHAQNTRRVLDPEVSLSRLFVLPPQRRQDGLVSLHILFVLAHQISDGLTNVQIILHFQDVLNLSTAQLRSRIHDLLLSLDQRLPPAQEELLPVIGGSLARRRWYWAITLVLRHVRRPPPASFTNPLRRARPIAAKVSEPRTFHPLLDYSLPPTLNGGNATAELPASHTRRLHALCRGANCSIGAGLFVLVALSMMHLHAELQPEIPSSERLPFAGSFPINPRNFLSPIPEANSCMLAFSSGVILPFLDPSLPLAGRFRLLVRSAQRQLRRYQKRPPPQDPLQDVKGPQGEASRAAQIQRWGADGVERVMAMNYIDIIERMDAKLPQHLRGGIVPGGLLLPRRGGAGGMATCGVSSVGRFHPDLGGGRYNVYDDDKDFVADLRGIKQGVRPRDGEFLVGIGGTDHGITATVSYDACAVDPALVERWKVVMETLLVDEEEKAKL